MMQAGAPATSWGDRGLDVEEDLFLSRKEKWE